MFLSIIWILFAIAIIRLMFYGFEYLESSIKTNEDVVKLFNYVFNQRKRDLFSIKDSFTVVESVLYRAYANHKIVLNILNGDYRENDMYLSIMEHEFNCKIKRDDNKIIEAGNIIMFALKDLDTIHEFINNKNIIKYMAKKNLKEYLSNDATVRSVVFSIDNKISEANNE